MVLEYTRAIVLLCTFAILRYLVCSLFVRVHVYVLFGSYCGERLGFCEWLLPNIEPTNKKIKICLVVIAGIKDKKITHEHIYWDQASVLVQIGLLDPKGLPVVGSQSADKLLTLSKELL